MIMALALLLIQKRTGDGTCKFWKSEHHRHAGQLLSDLPSEVVVVFAQYQYGAHVGSGGNRLAGA